MAIKAFEVLAMEAEDIKSLNISGTLFTNANGDYPAFYAGQPAYRDGEAANNAYSSPWVGANITNSNTHMMKEYAEGAELYVADPDCGARVTDGTNVWRVGGETLGKPVTEGRFRRVKEGDRVKYSAGWFTGEHDDDSGEFASYDDDEGLFVFAKTPVAGAWNLQFIRESKFRAGSYDMGIAYEMAFTFVPAGD